MAQGKAVRKYWREVSKEARSRALQQCIGSPPKIAVTVGTLLFTAFLGYEASGGRDASWLYRLMGGAIAIGLAVGLVYVWYLASIPPEREATLAGENASLIGRRDDRTLFETVANVADEARELMRRPNLMHLHWVNEVMEWRRRSIGVLSQVGETATLNRLNSFPTRERLKQAGNAPAEVQGALNTFIQEIEKRESDLEAKVALGAQPARAEC